MWKKWKIWDKVYLKSMLRAFAGRELKTLCLVLQGGGKALGLAIFKGEYSVITSTEHLYNTRA